MNSSSKPLNVTRVIGYDERDDKFPSVTGKHHVFQIHPHHYVSVRLVTDDHDPLPPQGAVLTLPDGAEHKLRISADGILKYEPAPEGLCSLAVEDLGRELVRFPTVPRDHMVIFVRVPPNPTYDGSPALVEPPEHDPSPIGDFEPWFFDLPTNDIPPGSFEGDVDASADLVPSEEDDSLGFDVPLLNLLEPFVLFDFAPEDDATDDPVNSTGSSSEDDQSH